MLPYGVVKSQDADTRFQAHPVVGDARRWYRVTSDVRLPINVLY